MLVVWQISVALAPLFAAWSVACAALGIRRSREDLAALALRGLAASTACALVASGALVWSLVRHDVAVSFVVRNFSVLIPGRYAVAAMLSAPGGALLAWAAAVGAIGLICVMASPRDTATVDGPRTWIVATLSAAMMLALLIVAAGSNPFAPLLGAPPEGAGLSPDLQRGVAVAHGAALLAGAAFATVAFVVTAGAIAARRLDAAWSRQVRVLDALALTALFAGAVAGARWAAQTPLHSPWLQNQSTALWLLPAAIGAWLVKLDASRATAETLVTRVLLIGATFIASAVAIAVQSGTFLTGAYAPQLRVGAWFGVLPLCGVLLLVALLRRGRGVLGEGQVIPAPVPHRVGGWIMRAGIVLVAAAAIGSGFTREQVVALGDAEIFRVKDPFKHQWSFASQGVSTLKRENFASLTLSVIPDRDNVRGEMLSAEARSYLLADDREPMPMVFTTGTRSGLFTETRLTIVQPDGTRPTVRIAFVPLAPWLVAGALLVALGMLLSATAPQQLASGAARSGAWICPNCGPRPESDARYCSTCGAGISR